MTFFIITAIIVLTVAATLDGYSTVRFLASKKAEYFETNPLFGKRPSTARVVVEGGLIILAELVLMCVAHGIWQNLLAAGYIFQAGFHLKCFLNNMQIPV